MKKDKISNRKRIEKAYFWPQWFFDSLNKSEQRIIPAAAIKKLCHANLYLWRALNLYDDFLDGESVPKNLPAANGYYRNFLKIYYRLNLDADFYKLFNRTMDNLDLANRQEASAPKIKITNGRINPPRRLPGFNNLKSLSQKSLALGLGAAAIMSFVTKKLNRDNSKNYKNSQKIKTVLNLFRYALAAKQLSDDSLDWLDDLRAGAITPANALILKAAKKRRIVLNFNKNPKIFYFLFIEAATKIAVGIKNLCFKARQEGLKIGLAPASPLFENLLAPMEKAAKKAKTAKAD